jgi:hypothetical protein
MCCRFCNCSGIRNLIATYYPFSQIANYKQGEEVFSILDVDGNEMMKNEIDFTEILKVME